MIDSVELYHPISTLLAMWDAHVMDTFLYHMSLLVTYSVEYSVIWGPNEELYLHGWRTRWTAISWTVILVHGFHLASCLMKSQHQTASWDIAVLSHTHEILFGNNHVRQKGPGVNGNWWVHDKDKENYLKIIMEGGSTKAADRELCIADTYDIYIVYGHENPMSNSYFTLHRW